MKVLLLQLPLDEGFKKTIVKVIDHVRLIKKYMLLEGTNGK